MRVEDIYIAGIGTADCDLMETSEAVALGYYDAEECERGGLLSISIAGTTPAPDLAIDGARRALDQAGHPVAEIDALFHTNVHPQGPDGWSAQHYINRHTINQPVTSVEVRNGCVGLFSNVHLAACYLSALPERRAALVTAADNFGTPSVDRWRASKQYVLADGGGALVLSKRSGFARLLSIDSASDPELEMRHRGGERLFPPSQTVGGMLNFRERMEYVHRQWAEGVLAPAGDFGSVMIDAAEKTFKDAGIVLDDIARVVHDGFTKEGLHDMFLAPLGIEEDLSIWEFMRRRGHAGPLDMIRGFEHLWRSGEVDVGDKVLWVSGAPGMEAACAILEILERP